ncbi:MarR family winged helix-turn-helix transcriptional regulator [Thalassococcus sp. S3]|uniref:MarR family winged helix-turn-helix transcriptional regulator n=1 Tax=Thalassococcus sp. S3 TaxID=2017482 RepID=UPI00102459E4|nr:MarR family transcriptional regulator [Thalassococcus sp. S3]QBF29940.1 hypothetical protein CFI11_01730 [Thalassococcus sp. S3]
MSNETSADELAGYVNMIMRAMLVAGRSGAPAEGRLPFNPLYFNMLRVLSAEGGARPSRLAEILSVPRTTISTAVKALEKRGLLRSEPDSQDRRALSVGLTGEGEEVLAAILRQDRRNAAAMLASLEEEERAHFMRAMKKVARGVSGAGDA